VIFQFLLVSFRADPDEGNHLDGNLPPTCSCSEEPMRFPSNINATMYLLNNILSAAPSALSQVGSNTARLNKNLPWNFPNIDLFTQSRTGSPEGRWAYGGRLVYAALVHSTFSADNIVHTADVQGWAGLLFQ